MEEVKYNGDRNTGHVWYMNDGPLFGCKMVGSIQMGSEYHKNVQFLMGLFILVQTFCYQIFKKAEF